MRRAYGLVGALFGASLISTGVGEVLIADDRAPAPRKTYRRRKPIGGFDPKINRWTGEPREHKREIARRHRRGEG